MGNGVELVPPGAWMGYKLHIDHSQAVSQESSKVVSPCFPLKYQQYRNIGKLWLTPKTKVDSWTLRIPLPWFQNVLELNWETSLEAKMWFLLLLFIFWKKKKKKKSTKQIKNRAILKKKKQVSLSSFPGPCKDQETGHYFSGVTYLSSIHQSSAVLFLYSFHNFQSESIRVLMEWGRSEWGEGRTIDKGHWVLGDKHPKGKDATAS